MSKPTIAHDLLYPIGDHVKRIREEERDNAIALFRSFFSDSVTDIRKCIDKVSRIDYYRLDYSHYMIGQNQIEDAIVSPGQKGNDDAYTPISFVMHTDMDAEHIMEKFFKKKGRPRPRKHAPISSSAMSELLKAGSVPNSDIRRKCLEKIKEARKHTYIDTYVYETILTILTENDHRAKSKKKKKKQSKKKKKSKGKKKKSKRGKRGV